MVCGLRVTYRPMVDGTGAIATAEIRRRLGGGCSGC